jgi:carbon monoxide dehydrogenase subunit G
VALEHGLVEQGLPLGRAREFVADAVFTSVIPARSFVYRVAGLLWRKPLKRARWGSKLMRRFYYTPPDWIIEDVDVEDGFGFDIRRCVVSEFMASLGEAELCVQAICAQDERSAAHHGVVFERSQTLASGGIRCDFRYLPEADTPISRSNAQLCDSVAIDAPPAEVWEWLSNMADRYTEWHPDHVSADWVRGEPNRIGSRFEAVEYLAGHREKLRFELTEVEPPHAMEYHILGAHSILIPRGRFLVLPAGTGCEFRAEIDIRLGFLLKRILRRRIDALRRHMREEGLYLKRLLEGSDCPSDETARVGRSGR